MHVWKSLPSIIEGGGIVSTFWPHLKVSLLEPEPCLTIIDLFLVGDELLDESDTCEDSLLLF